MCVEFHRRIGGFSTVEKSDYKTYLKFYTKILCLNVIVQLAGFLVFLWYRGTNNLYVWSGNCFVLNLSMYVTCRFSGSAPFFLGGTLNKYNISSSWALTQFFGFPEVAMIHLFLWRKYHSFIFPLGCL